MERGNRRLPQFQLPEKRIDCPLESGSLSLHTPLPFLIQFQCFYNRIFNFLRRRPRCKILADTISWDFELFFLVAFFFLHDGEDREMQKAACSRRKAE